jgi:cell division protein WhiA
MSLSEELRDELAAIAPRRVCDRLAELSALFHTAGTLHVRGRGEVAVHLDVGANAVARRAFSLLRDFGVHAEIRTYRQHAFERATRYQVHVAGDARALQTLNEAGVVTSALAPVERPPARVVARACCRGAYLRGALLGAGSLSGPGSPHLEIRTAAREGAEFVAGLAAEEGLELHVVDRRGHSAAYAKGIDTIAGLAAFAGASETALALAERAVVGETRSRANRLANADHANLVRSGRAAHLQLRAVRRLERTGRLDDLSPPLREIAELRLRHPSLSLRELGQKCRPPATKATAHRRLSKILHFAEQESLHKPVSDLQTN